MSAHDLCNNADAIEDKDIDKQARKSSLTKMLVLMQELFISLGDEDMEDIPSLDVYKGRVIHRLMTEIGANKIVIFDSEKLFFAIEEQFRVAETVSDTIEIIKQAITQKGYDISEVVQQKNNEDA